MIRHVQIELESSLLVKYVCVDAIHPAPLVTKKTSVVTRFVATVTADIRRIFYDQPMVGAPICFA